MKNHQILFTRPNVAELQENQLPDALREREVLIKTIYTVISPGTERANLIGEINISGERSACRAAFPRKLGYCGIGKVERVGSAVTAVKPGQKVVIYFGKHSEYNVVPESNAIPIDVEGVDDLSAALLVIAGFPAEGVRKTRLEFGESAMVVGLGILGLIVVQICRVAGAVPVIAVDPNPKRRQLALQYGADTVLDPSDNDFVEQVLERTDGKGVNVIVEASGNSAALRQALLTCAPMGRVSLLGCTRTPDTYDLYHDVHYKGVSLIGAHNFARPKVESAPGNWTAADDFRAMMKLIACGRLNLKALVSEIHAPQEAPEVYARLAEGRDFPIGVMFDWRMLSTEDA